MRYITLAIFAFIWTSCNAQVDYIYYDLPKAVDDKVEEYIKTSKIKDDRLFFAAKLSLNTDDHYLLSIIDYNEMNSSKVFGLLFDKVIKKSNRMLRIGDDSLPIITEEDILFANLGEVKMSDGRVAKKRVLMNFDGYTITFDRSGNIFEN